MSYFYDVYIINAISHRGSAIRDIIPARVGWPSFSASMSETIGSSLLDQRDGFEVGLTPCTCGASQFEATCCTDCPLRVGVSREQQEALAARFEARR